jgi:hypothetical protein
VEKGTLRRHPEFGIGINVGEKFIFTPEELGNLIEQAILTDNRFESVEKLDVLKSNSTLILNIVVRGAQSSGLIPLNLTV